MRLEAASDAVKGEQLGIRAGLFNYWDQDLEVILVSTELRKILNLVNVGAKLRFGTIFILDTLVVTPLGFLLGFRNTRQLAA